jgi:hypothetical protein
MPITALSGIADTVKTRNDNAMSTIENFVLRIETNCYFGDGGLGAMINNIK